MVAVDNALLRAPANSCMLRNAAREGRRGDVRAILASGIDPDVMSIQKHRFFLPWVHGRPALWHAVVHDHMGIVDDLLAHGANPNAIGWLSSTSLWTACSMGKLEMARRLLAAGADPNLPGCWGSPPLEAWMGSLAIPRAIDPTYGEPGSSLGVGALLVEYGARLDRVSVLWAEAERLLARQGYSPDLLRLSVELSSLLSQQQAQSLKTSTPDACNTTLLRL